MESVPTKARPYDRLIVRIIAAAIFLHGLLVMIDVLGIRLVGRSVHRTNSFTLNVALISALGLIYLSTRLSRRKQTAYWVAIAMYGLILLSSLSELLVEHEDYDPSQIIRSILLPLALVLVLLRYRALYRVKSDINSFALALRTVAIVLLAAFLYGVIGFQLLDVHDFHQQIGLPEAIHRTLDQFDFTTTHVLVPYTRRAQFFLDTLTMVSFAALVYAAISLFRPLRFRFADDVAGRQQMDDLLHQYEANSEDFFKLWPHDKNYLFTADRDAGLAFRVNQGVALVVADPVGETKAIKKLMKQFNEACEVNGWLPAYVHVTDALQKDYEQNGYNLQKIGEEAVVDLAAFKAEVASTKYFRQIRNRFEKQGYTTELLRPPHDAAVLRRLRHVSNDWLELPGRSERGFMMGYFSDAYLQLCNIMVLRDSAGTIQGFINQIPSFDKAEANFDFLRHTREALGNSNDFLLMHFIEYVQKEGFKRINLGLCPLAGLSNQDQDKTVVDSALSFVYSNGDRFYSFSGLQRFKAKYQPEWRPRYLAYQNGIAGFSRTLAALNRAMRVRS